MLSLQFQNRWARFAFGISVTLTAGFIELGLNRVFTPPVSPFLLGFAAVALSATRGGTGAGLLSTAIVTIWSAWGLHAQSYTTAAILVRCAIFFVESLVVCACCEALRRLQKEAVRGERWHRKLMETAAEGVSVTDEHGSIKYVNPRLCEILGVTAEQLIGHREEEFLFPEDHAVERIRKQNRLEGRTAQFDRRMRRADGSEAWLLSASSSFVGSDGRIELLSMMTDITERKRAEQALRRSEARFRELFENVLEGVYQSSPAGRILDANPMLLSMLGLKSAAEFEDIHIADDLYPDPDVRRQLLERLERDGSFRNVEYDLRRTDGQTIRVVENARVVRGDDGRVLYYEGTLTDVTEKREMEERLKTAQEAEAAGRMASAIAQDFSDALTAVSGYGHLTLDELDESHPAWANAVELVKAAEHASQLTLQLAGFGRTRPGYSDVFDLNRLVAGIEARLLRIAGPDVALTVSTAESPVLLRADPTHIEQVALSLATSMRQSIEGTGSLAVKADSAMGFGVLSIRATGIRKGLGHRGLSTIQTIVLQYGGAVTEDQTPESTLISVLMPESNPVLT